MLKKTIKYEDFNGDEVEEDFFFHLSKAELVELELSQKGGLAANLKRIIDAEDGKGIITEFKNIILNSYGKKSDDGKRFIKNQELRDEFASSEAYSVLFMELATDTDVAIEFINGIVPQGLAEEVAKLAAAEPQKPNDEKVTVLTPEGAPPVEMEVITREDLIHMSHDQVAAARERIAAGTARLEGEEDRT